MTAIAFVSVINNYHINGLHLFWDTLYNWYHHCNVTWTKWTCVMLPHQHSTILNINRRYSSQTQDELVASFDTKSLFQTTTFHTVVRCETREEDGEKDLFESYYIQVCGFKNIRLTRRFSLFCILNKWNKQADEISVWLTGWGRLFGDKRLLWSGRTVLLGEALRTVDDSTGVWPLLGLFISSQLQTPTPENTTCGKKKMIGWKIDFFYNRIFWDFG